MTAVTPRGLLLFGLPNRWHDVVLSSLMASVVVVSRFGFLANGPWEWDETLFARGILHFELAAHFPHPPGFPGWLAIGHLLTPLTGDPLLSLQLASAAFSVAALWVLAALGRRVAPPAVAATAALAILAAPGPWLFAVRGFSTTAASVLALAAASVLAGGLQGKRLTVFTVLVSASFLVRPHLVPALALLWVAGVWSVRPLRRLLPGVATGIAAGVVALLLMVRAEGGWNAFWAPFAAHSQRHFSRLVGNLGGYPELGLVKGMGGTFSATVVMLVALFGIVVWARRRGRREAALWVIVLTVSTAQLVWLQNRTYGRYAVGVQMAMAPLVAAAAATAPPVVACAGLLGLAGWFGGVGLPLVDEQHTTQLPAWRAVQRARSDALADDRTVVLEPELHPFASYLWHLAESRGEPSPPWVLSPWDPQPWAGVDQAWVVATVHRRLYLDPLFGLEERWADVSAGLRPLTQQRFLEAWVLQDVPLPIHGWWPVESSADGRRFMWGGAEAEMLVPPVAGNSRLGLELRSAPGSEPTTVRWDTGDEMVVDGEDGAVTMWIEAPPGAVGRVSSLAVARTQGYRPGGDDQRSLALQIFSMRAVDPARHWKGSVAHRWQRLVLQVDLDGGHPSEIFEGVGRGVWLKPRAVLGVPATTGTLKLRVWAPRPTPSRTRFLVSDRLVGGPWDIASSPTEIEIPVSAGDVRSGRLELEIVSDPYVPGASGLLDSRELGVVLSSLEFTPSGPGLDAPERRP